MGKFNMRRRAVLRAGRSKLNEPDHSGGFAGTAKRNAILAACDRYQANLEFKAQHGPVRILSKDGRPVDQGNE